jgi:hypothetical protein
MIQHTITPLATASSRTGGETPIADQLIRRALAKGAVIIVREAACRSLGRGATLQRAEPALKSLAEHVEGATQISIIDGSGEQGWGAGHPELRALCESVRRGEVALVWMRDESRLGRKASALPGLLAAARENDVQVILGNACPKDGWPDVNRLFAAYELLSGIRDHLLR